MKSKVAMIGCEGIGSYHLEHLLQFDDIVLAGFCDLIAERAQRFCDKAGTGKAYTNFRQMYDEVAPDMVFICVPPFAHGEIEYETIRRGIHFFVEKPLALDIALAKDIARKVKEAGLITAVGFQCRYASIIKPSLRFMQDNEVVLVEASRITGIPEIPWWSKKSKSGGMLAESTIHQLDIIRYLYDEPELVFSLGTRGFVKRDNFDVEDLTTTVIRFRGGGLGVLSSGCYATEGASFDSRITFSAADKRAVHKIIESLDIYEKDETASAKDGFVIKGDGGLDRHVRVTALTEETNPGLTCDRTFVQAVLTGDASAIRSPYEDGLKSLVFALSCNESLDTGLPVSIVY